MKDCALALGGSTNTGGADYELSKHLKLLLKYKHEYHLPGTYLCVHSTKYTFIYMYATTNTCDDS